MFHKASAMIARLSCARLLVLSSLLYAACALHATHVILARQSAPEEATSLELPATVLNTGPSIDNERHLNRTKTQINLGRSLPEQQSVTTELVSTAANQIQIREPYEWFTNSIQSENHGPLQTTETSNQSWPSLANLLNGGRLTAATTAESASSEPPGGATNSSNTTAIELITDEDNEQVDQQRGINGTTKLIENIVDRFFHEGNVMGLLAATENSDQVQTSRLHNSSSAALINLAGAVSAASTRRPGSGERPLATLIVATPSPFTQINISGPYMSTDDSDSDEMVEQGSSQDQDRHIHYDSISVQTMPQQSTAGYADTIVEAVAPATPRGDSRTSKLHARHVTSNHFERPEMSERYMMDPSIEGPDTGNDPPEPSSLQQVVGGQGSPDSGGENFTLPIVRVASEANQRQVNTNGDNSANKTSNRVEEASNSTSVVLSNSLVELPLDPATHQQAARVGSIQARSMGAISAVAQAAQQSFSAGKTPQHTRPPYATYDQFQKRADVVAGAQQQQQHETVHSEQKSQSQKSSPQQQHQQNSPDLSYSNSDDNRTPLSQLDQGTNIRNPSTSLGVAPSVNVAPNNNNNNNDNNNNNNSSTSGAGGHELGASMSQISDQLTNEGSSSSSRSGGLRSKGSPQGGATVLEDKQLLHKLAPTNQLAELYPLPSVASESADTGSATNPLALLNRLYFSKDFDFHTQPDSNNNNNNRADRYTNSATNLEANNEPPLGIHPLASNEISATGGGGGQLDSQRYHDDSAKHLHLATYEREIAKLNSQYHQSLQQGPQHRSSIGHHQVSGGSGSAINSNNKLVAASFYNLSGPLVPPLSATEAWESELGNSVAKGGVMHQVSGLLRPPPGGASGQVGSIQGSTEKPSQMRQYFLPQTAESQKSQSIYSQPANKYSPKPSSQHSSYFDSMLASDSSNNPTDLNGNNNSSYMEERTRVDRNTGYIAPRNPPSIYRAPGLSSTTNSASGFRSPSLLSSLGAGGEHGGSTSPTASSSSWPPTRQPVPSNSLYGPTGTSLSSSSPGVSMSTFSELQQHFSTAPSATESSASLADSTNSTGSQTRAPTALSQFPGTKVSATNGTAPLAAPGGGTTAAVVGTGGSGDAAASAGLNKRVFNLTRVEHISAECSNDLIRTIIIFNGTFKGIIYSSGYVRDPNCMYINGTGKTKYDFSIRMNQCGTLGRQEIHPPNGPNEVRRRDQVMWNTLSIQYNPIIEQEWDEHFRVSCEYGSDFWKTVSFSPFNVETNTGSPVVFTVDPPQCQMEILRGHGMVGPRQEAVSGPVTVGDPLTLLIHMRSEKAGYDILVKNCVAHNGGHQKMQLIDSNGCVINERFISPFRGTYNDNDMKHVTLFSYLKAFRFTGSPVLYLECEIHMCQSSCPPQMCYWRRLSKRSASNDTSHLYDGEYNSTSSGDEISNEFINDQASELISANDGGPTQFITTTTTAFYQDEEADQRAHEGDEMSGAGATATRNKTTPGSHRRLRMLDFGSSDSHNKDSAIRDPRRHKEQQQHQRHNRLTTATTSAESDQAQPGQMSDKVNLFKALKVIQPDERWLAGDELASYSTYDARSSPDSDLTMAGSDSLMCYRRAEVLALLFTAVSILLVAISVTVGCCWQASLRRRQEKTKCFAAAAAAASASGISSSANFSCGNSSSSSSNISPVSSAHSGASYCSSATGGKGSLMSEPSTRGGHQRANNILHTSPYQKALTAMVPMWHQPSARHKNHRPL